jgi:hypothetical protein
MTVAVSVMVSACGAGGSAPTTTSTTSTTVPTPAATTTVAPSTTTTVGLPPSPQASDQQASEDLITAWAEGNKAAALAVATPSAVASLFAFPYPAGNAVFRGCTVSFPPLICTFGAPGGGNPNAAIIEVSVTEIAAGWYDSAVEVET